jgi:AcrR family transcriptional regulator
MNVPDSQRRRTYRMTKRDASAAETRQRIIRATIQLYGERFHDQITLEDIADRAAVTVQTVLRRFGSRDGLLEACGEAGASDVGEQRAQAPVGDVPGIVGNLFDHYEEWGGPVLRALAQEDRVPQLKQITSRGRRMHREWVRTVFEPTLETARDRSLLEAQLAALTDVYVWKLLRRDLGLDRERASAALEGMIEGTLRTGGDQ